MDYKKIVVINYRHDKSAELVFEYGRSVFVKADYVEKYKPQIGGFYINEHGKDSYDEIIDNQKMEDESAVDDDEV